MALQPLPQVWVRSSRHFLGQLFSSPLREHATLGVEQWRWGPSGVRSGSKRHCLSMRAGYAHPWPVWLCS